MSQIKATYVDHMGSDLSVVNASKLEELEAAEAAARKSSAAFADAAAYAAAAARKSSAAYADADAAYAAYVNAAAYVAELKRLQEDNS